MRDEGFTLSEILVAVGIVGVLTAIAVPVTLSQQSRAADVATKSDLTSVSSAIESALLTWRGAPVDGALNICHNDPTYPSEATPTNTCDNNEWVATIASTGNLPSPALGGRLSPGVSLTGRISATGAYCITASNSRLGAGTFHLDSETSQIGEGTCYTAGWIDPWQDLEGPALSPAEELPPAPTGIKAEVTGNVVTVSWNGTAGTTFAVSVSSQPIKTLSASTTGIQTCMFPATDCSGPSIAYLPAGSYTATVRAQGENGWGPGASIDFGVTTTPPGGTSGGTPEQISTVFGSDTLYRILFGAQASASALESYITTPSGRQDFERLLFSSPQTVLNSETAMAAVVDSPTARSIVLLDPAVYGAYTISSAAMRAILASPSALVSVMTSSTAMSMVASSRSAMSVLANSPAGMEAVVTSATATNALANSSTAALQVVTTPSALSALTSSPTALSRFVESSTAISTLVSSSEAMTSFANNLTAMATLADSPSAMNIVVTSSSARTAILNSTAAMAVVNTKPVALGKLAAGAAGVDPAQFGDMAAIVASPAAMSAVAASPSARALIGASSFAMGLISTSDLAVAKYAAGLAGTDPTVISGGGSLSGASLLAVYANPTAWQLLTRSTAGMTGLASSRASMDTAAANSGMYTDILSRTASLNIIAASDAGRSAFLSSAQTAPVIAADSTFTLKFLGGYAQLSPATITTVDSITSSANAWQAVLSSAQAIDLLVSSPSVMAQVSGAPRSALLASTIAATKLMASQAGLNPSQFDSIATMLGSSAWASSVVGSEAAMATLAQSTATLAAVTANSSAMMALAGSTTATTEVLKSTAAVDVLVASSTAMNAISAQAVGRTKFNADNYAMARIRSTKMAIAKFVAGMANVDPSNFADADALAANQSAMTSVAASSAAVTALAGSDIGTSSVWSSSIAASTLAGSQTAMDILRNSAVAMNNMAYLQPAVTAVNGSTIAMTSLSTSQTAMDVIAGSSMAMSAIAPTPGSMNILVASPEAMNSLSANAVARNLILGSTGLSNVRASAAATGKFVAGYVVNTRTDVARINSAASLSRVNLLSNPSFEANVTSGWVSAGSAAPSLAPTGLQSWSGAVSMSLTATAAGTSQAGSNSAAQMRVDGLQNYAFSAYVRSTTARDASAGIEWFDRTGALISTSISNSTALTPGSWTRISVAAGAPSSAVTARPYIGIAGVLPGEVQQVDAALFEQAGLVQPYFDGGTTGAWASWLGTANLSPSTSTLVSSVLANATARAVLFGSPASMLELAPLGRFVDAIEAVPAVWSEAEASSSGSIMITAVARNDARYLANQWATMLTSNFPAAGARLRMSLGTSYGTGALQNLYAYANNTSSAAITDFATAAKPSWLANETRLDLSSADNNIAVSATNFCLAVNYKNTTVFQEYRGFADGSPVNNCSSSRTAVVNATGIPAVLTVPTITSATASSVSIGSAAAVSGSASNFLRQEWLFPEMSSGSAAATASVTYNSTGTRNLVYRVQGSAGEARTSAATSPSAITVQVDLYGSYGGTGGTSYPYGYTGAGGSAGGWISGNITVTSLPYQINFGGIGNGSGGNGANAWYDAWGTYAGGGGGGGRSGGGGWQVQWTGCNSRGCRTVSDWGGGGGGSGYDAFAQILVNGTWTTVMTAGGGAGGIGGGNGGGGAGGAAGSTSASGGYVTTLNSGSSGYTTTQGAVTCASRGIGFTWVGNGVYTIPAG